MRKTRAALVQGFSGGPFFWWPGGSQALPFAELDAWTQPRLWPAVFWVF
ncbi:MAG: hypothetical protein M3170_08675 [Candidatus Dormibacteraeota bacterium]|nr:hypothetical protein [Candidatus Dormibacteraeota bacterium]